MNRRDFLRHTAVFAGSTAAAATLIRNAQAQTPPRRDLRLVFARGGELFASPALDGADARRVLTVETDDLWAVSPDGRRVVWMAQSSGGDAGKTGATVFLSDLLGRHQKKLLSLGDLRDRQNKPVTRAGVDNSEALNGWRPVSLGWSADGRTVYVGFARADNPIEPTVGGAAGGFKRATFAADAVNGTALVDGDGRWKLLAPLTHIDAQGGLLAGIDVFAPAEQTSTVVFSGGGGPIALVNMAEGGIRTILGGGSKIDLSAAQPFDIAGSLALAPDHRNIAYVSTLDKGLWLRDRWAGTSVLPRKLAERATGRPQWGSDGKQVFFLQDAPAPAADGTIPQKSSDLYQVDVPTKEGDVASSKPRLVLKNVQSFTLAPL